MYRRGNIINFVLYSSLSICSWLQLETGYRAGTLDWASMAFLMFSCQLLTTIEHQNQEQQSYISRAQTIWKDIPTPVYVIFYGQSSTCHLYVMNSKSVKFKILHRIFCSESSSTFIELITYAKWPFMLLDNVCTK